MTLQQDSNKTETGNRPAPMIITHLGIGTKIEFADNTYELVKELDGGFNFYDETGHYALGQGFYQSELPSVERVNEVLVKYLTDSLEQRKKEFNEHMRLIGIDPDNPESEEQKRIISFSWITWTTQQSKIDGLEMRAAEVKRASNAL